MRTGREAAGCEPGRERSLDTQSASVLISAFQPPVSNKFLLFISCPDGGILLQQPEQTKTPANWSALTCQSLSPGRGLGQLEPSQVSAASLPMGWGPKEQILRAL